VRVGLDASESFVPEVVGPGYFQPKRIGATSRAGLRRRQRRSLRPTRPRRNITIPWSRTRLLSHGTGDRLSIDTPSQGLAMAQARLAGLFGMAPDKIHIRSPFLGGGFGSKGLISGPQVLGGHRRPRGGPAGQACVAARADVSVRWAIAGSTRQTPAVLAPTADAALTAARSPHQEPCRARSTISSKPASNVSQTLYASTRHRHLRHEGVRSRHRHAAVHARRPARRSGSIALERRHRRNGAGPCGMESSGVFASRNYAEVEPIIRQAVLFKRPLRECYRQGAERFGWGAPAPSRPRLYGAIVTACYLVGAWARRHFRRSCLLAQARCGGTPRRQRCRGDWRATIWDRGAWTRARPDRGRWTWTSISISLNSAPAVPIYPTLVSAGGSSHTATAGTAIQNGRRRRDRTARRSHDQ